MCMQLMLYILCIFIPPPLPHQGTKKREGTPSRQLSYFVPNKRSPASPRPGTTYPWSFNFSSNAAT